MPHRSRVLVSIAAAVMLVAGVPSAQGPAAGPALAEPGISPDGAEIAFASGGDIWTAPLGGTAPAVARLLVSHPATESRPLYSPAGDALAFVSTRTGNGDIYVLRFADGTLSRVTFDDAPELLDGWSRDGRFIFFSTNSRDITGMNDVLRVPAAGGTPMPVTNERYTSEFFSAASPDGGSVAFSARGNALQQWWRNGHSHLDESEIWTVSDAGYRRVIDRGAKALWPMWSGDGRAVFFMSDRSGSENIWRAAVAAPASATNLTRFARGRVLWPSITTDGRTIAFERDFAIWTLDTATGRSAAVPIELRGVPASPPIERQRYTSQFTEMSLSPDGRKVALVVRGEVFAGPSRDGGDAERITTTPGRDFGVTWMPDNRTLLFVSHRDGSSHLISYDIAARRETTLASFAGELGAPVVSPDGKSVALVEGRQHLKALAVDSRQARTVASGFFPGGENPGRIAWSPDSQWLAYAAVGSRGFSNVNVWPATAANAAPRPASFLANFNINSIAWAPDGTFLTFVTGQRTEEHQVARVDLVLRTPKFREDRFRGLFEPEPPKPSPGAQEAAPPAPRVPLAPVWEDIRRRLSLLPIGLDVQEQIISPDGKMLLVTASVAGQPNLYTYSIDDMSREPAVARQLTSTPGVKDSAQFSPDGKEVYFLDAGRAQAITIEDRRVRSLDLTAEMDVDFVRERGAVFQQAWRMLNDQFFDARHNGVDWVESGKTYAARVQRTATPDEFRRVALLMIGDLNASHLGFNPPAGSGAAPFTGRLGVSFDAAEYSRSGTLRVVEVLPLGPAALAGIRTGDAVAAVDGVRIAASTNLDERLQHTIGRRVTIAIASAGGGERDVAVRPVNLATEKALRYRAWVEHNRALVARLSGGRLGYAHMIDMGAPSLEQLFIDLDADNHGSDGIVIDVRNNNGGFVNVYAIDVLARRSFFNMTRRGDQTVPSRSMLGQRALERPTILLTNQHSLSDAEDFTEGYRSLKLGTVVGEPTSGWIIYTSNVPLMDGSILRVPGTRITASDGSDMEMRPRPVDVPVTRPLGESARGVDSQIEAAVKTLLGQLVARGTRSQ
jgi:Tol biopolymer transport system component/C-terminal processing protease CtpA/Prc